MGEIRRCSRAYLYLKIYCCEEGPLASTLTPNSTRDCGEDVHDISSANLRAAASRLEWAQLSEKTGRDSRKKDVLGKPGYTMARDRSKVQGAEVGWSCPS
jgi:hypothetical protein